MKNNRQNIAPKSDIGFLLISFLIWPLFSFIISVAKFQNKHTRSLIVLFFGFFGLTIDVSREGSDGYNHAMRFENTANITFSELLTNISNIIERKSRAELDVYIPIVNFFVSIFTTSPQMIFVVHGLIFGFFSVKVFGLIYDEFQTKFNSSALLFFLLILFINPISNIHFIRFPIASIVFIYGVLQLIKTEQKRYIWWCALAALIHFSFITALVVVFIYAFFGNRIFIYLCILALSYVMPSLLFGYLKGFGSGQIGEGLEHKINSYGDESYIEARNSSIEGTNWYKRLQIPFLHYSCMVIIAIISFFEVKFQNQERMQKGLLSFGVLFLAFVNFGFAFDSLGRRFLIVWIFLAAVYLFRHYQLKGAKKPNLIVIFSILPVTFWIIMQIRIGLQVMSPLWLIGNPIIALFVKMSAVLN